MRISRAAGTGMLAGSTLGFDDTPADLVAARSTLTGEHLAAYAGA